MRLDRMNPEGLKLVLAGLPELARSQPGKTAWTLIRTSEADGVQVGLKWDGYGYIVYLRRPNGKEYLQEMEVILRALNLGRTLEITEAQGKLPRKWGPRKYLVAIVVPEGEEGVA